MTVPPPLVKGAGNIPHCDYVILNRLVCEESLFFLSETIYHQSNSSFRAKSRNPAVTI